MAYKSKDIVRISVALPKELDNKLVILSKRMHISKTKLVIQMVETNIDTLSKAWTLLSNPNSISQMAILSQQLKNSNIPGFENIDDNLNEKTMMELNQKLDDIPQDVKDVLTKK